VAFSPDGKTLAVGTASSGIRLWDTATGKVLPGEFKDHLNSFMALSFSPDGKMLAVGGYPNAGGFDSRVHLLEVATGKELQTLRGHSNCVRAVAFSPNGRWLASGGFDQTVRLWEIHARLASPCHEFRGHTAEIASLAFSPDGQRLASGSHDSTALIWDVTGLTGGQTRTARLNPKALTACWQSLMDADAAQAYQTLRTLAAAPDQVVPFLTGHLLWKKPDPRQLAQVAGLLAELDSEDFRVRSKAAKDLEKLVKEIEQLGGTAELALRQALRDDPTVEVRRRIQQLLEAIDPPREGMPPRLLRWLRALEVLEWINNSAARELLEKVAASPPREEVGRAAQAALKRLRARPIS